MAYDYDSLSVDELLTIATTDADEFRRAAIDELKRNAELAAKYVRLTQALAVHVAFNLDMLLTGDNVQVGSCEDFDYVRDPASHDGTPEGIAAAIIAASEGRQ